MKMQRFFCGVLGVWLLSAPALYAAPMLQEKVVAIAGDQTLQLASTGRAVFADLVFPDAALAERALGPLLLQQNVSFSVRGIDRYSRSLIDSPAALDLLRTGVAVHYATAPLPEGWAAAEADAQRGRRGIWASPDFVLRPENAAQHIGEFHVIEGQITRIYEAKKATYLNFGSDWHSDFSVTIPGRARRSFASVQPLLHQGSRLQIRGLIAEENGPMVTLTRPEQISVR